MSRKLTKVDLLFSKKEAEYVEGLVTEDNANKLREYILGGHANRLYTETQNHFRKNGVHGLNAIPAISDNTEFLGFYYTNLQSAYEYCKLEGGMMFELDEILRKHPGMKLPRNLNDVSVNELPKEMRVFLNRHMKELQAGQILVTTGICNILGSEWHVCFNSKGVDTILAFTV